MSKLTNSLGASIGFQFVNLAAAAKKVCLFPGHYDTEKVLEYTTTRGESSVTLFKRVNSNEANLVAAGHTCVQVIDDFDANDVNTTGANTHNVKCIACDAADKFIDVRRYAQLVGLKVSKIRVTNNTSNQAIFNSALEIMCSVLGQTTGSDKLKFREHRSNAAFDQSWIDIDLSASPLLIDATTIIMMEVPASADFTLDFTLA